MKEKRLLKLADFADSPETTQMEAILDLEEKIDSTKEELVETISLYTKKICEDIYDIPNSLPNDQSKIEAILAKLDQEDEITITLNIV